MALFFNKKKKNVKSSNSILTEKQRQKILVKANSLIRGISDSRENLSYNSEFHCLINDAGATIKMFAFFSNLS